MGIGLVRYHDRRSRLRPGLRPATRPSHALPHRAPSRNSRRHAADPIRLRERWPEAEIVNLLDDGLSLDRARGAELTEAMIERFVAFGT
jgi:hypothetical protein